MQNNYMVCLKLIFQTPIQEITEIIVNNATCRLKFNQVRLLGDIMLTLMLYVHRDKK